MHISIYAKSNRWVRIIIRKGCNYFIGTTHYNDLLLPLYNFSWLAHATTGADMMSVLDATLM